MGNDRKPSLTPEANSRKAFGERLRASVPAGMKLADFAKAIGAGLSTLQEWMSGKSDVGREKLAVILDVTGVSPLWLVTGEGEMRPGAAAPTQPTRDASAPEIDLDLQGQISEQISEVYRECGVPVTLRQLVAEAGRIAQDVSGPDFPDADRPGAIRYAVAQLRRQLLVANTPGASSKSSA